MARIFFSTFIGTGTLDDSYRPAIAQYAKHWRIFDGRANTALSAGQCLVEAELTPAEYVLALADPNITELLPRERPFLYSRAYDDSLLQRLNTWTAQELQDTRAALEARHIPVGDIQLTDTVGSVLRKIWRRFLLRAKLGSLDFTENLDALVSSIPSTRRTQIRNRLTALGFDVSVVVNTMTIRQALKALHDQSATRAAVAALFSNPYLNKR